MTRERPAAIIAHVLGADGAILDLLLGRCDYHPTAVAPDPEAVAAFRAAVAGSGR